MKKPSIFNQISDKLSIAPKEFYIILFLTTGCCLGLIGKTLLPFDNNNSSNNLSPESINHILDSLIELEKLTYTGSDINNQPNEELAKLDTITYKNKSTKTEFKGIININTASKKELMQLRNIGEKTAEKIIEYRQHTPFRRVEDILYVKGIGPKTFELIKNNIRI